MNYFKLPILLLILCPYLNFSQSTFSNNLYYYYKGEQKALDIDFTSIYISVLPNFDKASIVDNRITSFELESYTFKNTENNLRSAKIKFGISLCSQEYFTKVNDLKKLNGVRTVSPCYINENNLEVGTSEGFYVKLISLSDSTLLKNQALIKNVEILGQDEFMPNWYVLRCNSNTSNTTLEIANYFHETGLFASAEPDFFNEGALCSNDPDFLSYGG